jgi:hypothetical protein
MGNRDGVRACVPALPNDEQLNAAIEANLHLLSKDARKALTFTRWRDGIDCEYLTVDCRGFVAGVLLHLAAAPVSGVKGDGNVS